jgi:hypothetical protein
MADRDDLAANAGTLDNELITTLPMYRGRLPGAGPFAGVRVSKNSYTDFQTRAEFWAEF